MEIRTYTNLRAFNKLGMSAFWLDKLERGDNGTQNLLIVVGEYAEYFGATIKFIGIEYLAIPIAFIYSTLHQAPQEDLSLAGEYPGSKIYYAMCERFRRRERLTEEPVCLKRS